MDLSPGVEDAMESLAGSGLCPRGLCLVQEGRFRCVCSSFHPRDFRCRTLQEMTQAGVQYAPMTESPFPHDMAVCARGNCLITRGTAECNCASEDEGERSPNGDLPESPGEQGRNGPWQGTTSSVPESNQRMTRARARALREAEGVCSQAGGEGARHSPGRSGEVEFWPQVRHRPQRGDQGQEALPVNGEVPMRRGSAAEARELAAKKEKKSKLRNAVNVCLAMLYAVTTFLLSVAHCVIRVAGVTRDYLSPYSYVSKAVTWLRLRLFNVRA